MTGGKMEKITYIIIPLVVIIIFFIAKKSNRKAEKNMDENHFSVQQPKIFLWIGIICVAFFCALIVLMTLFPNDTAEWWVYVIFSFFVLLGLFLIIYCSTWKLQIENDQIVYCPFFGIKRNFLITSITNIKTYNGQKIKAYIDDKKIFTIEYTAKGYGVLISRLKNEQMPFKS